MRKEIYRIFIFAVTLSVILGSGMAIGGTDGVYIAKMMGESEGMMDPHMMGPGMKGHMMGKHSMKKGMGMTMYPWEYLKERLDLTDEQAKQLGKIHNEYRKEVLRKSAEIEIATMELTELLTMKKSSEKEIEKVLGKFEALRSDLYAFRIKTLLKARGFLSDEQYERLAHFITGWMGPHSMRKWVY